MSGDSATHRPPVRSFKGVLNDRRQTARRDSDRLRELEISRAVTDQRLDDHDQVLKDIRTHLEALVNRIGSFEKKLVVLTTIVLATAKGGDVLSLLGL